MSETKNIKYSCFVCHCATTSENSEINKEVYLPVCNTCSGTEKEKKVVEE